MSTSLYVASLRTIEAEVCLGVRDAFRESSFLVARLGVLVSPQVGGKVLYVIFVCIIDVDRLGTTHDSKSRTG